jgi:gliding motility-associated-like protein
MRNFSPKILKNIPLLLILLTSVQLNAQTISLFNLTIENDVQVDDKNMEFDLYLLDSDATEPFELNMIQVGILVNPGIYNGGTITVTRIPGTSELVVAQQPGTSNISWTQASNIIKVTPRLPTAQGEGTIISQTGLGTRICRLHITNTVAFTSNSTANLSFNFTTSPYPTKVFQTTDADPDGIELACNTTNCFSNATNIILNNTALTVTPTAIPGTVCSGQSVQLNAGAKGGSGDYNYIWTSSPVGFSSTLANPTVNPTVVTIYYVSVNDGTTIVNSQIGVTVNSLPTANITYAGSPYCKTGIATVTRTGQSGGIYSSTTGLSINSGTGEINLANSTPGNYTVTYSFTDGTCSNTTTAGVNINSLPPAPVAGNVTKCFDGSIYSGSATPGTGETVVWYTASSGGTITSAPSGSSVGVYSAWAASKIIATGCESSTRTQVIVTINALPSALVLTGSTICLSPGGNGTITSSTSVSGVNYQLYTSGGLAVGTPKSGTTGSGLTWSSLPAGNGYYVVGTNATTFCVSAASNSVNVSTTANPASLALTGSTICNSPGGNGTIASSASEIGVNYQLYNGSNAAVQSAKPGTGSALTWTGLVAGSGYYVIGTNGFPCTSTSNTVNITTYTNPSALTLTGSTVCSLPGGDGYITSSTSVSGVNYQLYNSAAVPIQSPITGTGSGLTWTGLAVGSGYYAIGTNTTTSCVSPSSNTVSISSSANPAALTLTGDIICSSPGGDGIITSSTSVSGVNYQLFTSGGVPVGTSKPGTGSGLTWSSLGAGTGYYVIGTNASTLCVSPASNLVNVSTTANPASLVLTGNTICTSPGGNGTITSTTSVLSVNYQLYNSSNAALQSAKPGTGSSLAWNNISAGNGYYVIGTNGSSCTSTSNTVNITTYTNPVALVLTGSSICTIPGGFGTIFSTTSVVGISYQLYNSAAVPIQAAIPGTGSGLSWTGLSAGNGYYAIGTNTSTSCVSTGSNSVNISTVANPVPLVLSGSVICVSPGNNGTISSTTSVAGVSYQLYNSGNATVQSPKSGTGSGLIWTDLPASFGYYVVGTNSSYCTSTSNTANITTTTNPVALTLTGSTICSSPGGNGTITSSFSVIGVSYQLFNGSNATVQSPQSGTGSGLTWSNLNAGDSYYVVGTNASSCTSTSNSVNVSTNTSPLALVLTGGTICSSPGGLGTITSSSSVLGVSYQLYDGNNTVVQAAKAGTGFGLSWTNLPAATGYYVIGTNATTCTTTSNIVNVTTYSNPVALVLTGSTICASPGGNGTITSSTSASGVNYQLYNSGNVVVGTAKAGTGSGLTWSSLPAGSGYYVIGTNTTTLCVSQNSNSVNVLTTPNPAAPIVGTITNPTCSIATGGVFLSGLPSATWTINPGNISGSATSETVSGLTAGTYNFTVTNSLSCVSPQSTSVVINAQPSVPSAPAATVTQPTCSIATGSITVTNPASGTGYEYSVGGPFQTGTTFTALSAGDYYVTVRSLADISCISAPTSLTVNTQPITPVVVITNPSSVCSPSTVDLTAPAITSGSTSGLTYSYWTNAAATSALTTPASTGAGTYYIKGTTSAGCYDIKPVTVTVNSSPVVNAGADGSECDLDYILKAVPESGSITGLWAKTSGPGNVTFSPGADKPDATVSVDQPGTYDFSWTQSNGICQNTDGVRIIFHTPPPVNAGKDTVTCLGTNIKLQAVGTGSFHWTPSVLVSNPDIENPVAFPIDPTNFVVTLTDQYGCVNRDTVFVDVWDTPFAFAGADTTLNYIFKLNLKADALNPHETGLWSAVKGSAHFDDPTDPATQVTELGVGENIILWTVTNGLCTDFKDYVSIYVNNLVIPTLITPNGDQHNEYFILNGIETLGRTELLIFDRRGTRVYKNDNYNNDWNGLDYNGNTLPDDTYFYTIRGQNGVSMSGYIVIRR